jgi:hypothetical protein
VAYRILGDIDRPSRPAAFGHVSDMARALG